MGETKTPDSTAVEARVSAIFEKANALLGGRPRSQRRLSSFRFRKIGVETPLTATAFDGLIRIFATLKAFREAVMCHQEVLAI
jgi:hypothetical protein